MAPDPWTGAAASDQHPDHDVQEGPSSPRLSSLSPCGFMYIIISNPGERLIKEVYEAIRNGPQWESTMLIITCATPPSSVLTAFAIMTYSSQTTSMADIGIMCHLLLYFRACLDVLLNDFFLFDVSFLARRPEPRRPSSSGSPVPI